MHPIPQWKENHRRENFGKVSQMLTSPVLSAETCRKFRENFLAFKIPLPVTCLLEQTVRLSATPHLPSWQCSQDTGGEPQSVSSIAHTRWRGELEPQGSPMLGPTEGTKGAEGPCCRLNTGALLSVCDIFRTSWNQAAITFLLSSVTCVAPKPSKHLSYAE